MASQVHPVTCKGKITVLSLLWQKGSACQNRHVRSNSNYELQAETKQAIASIFTTKNIILVSVTLTHLLSTNHKNISSSWTLTLTYLKLVQATYIQTFPNNAIYVHSTANHIQCAHPLCKKENPLGHLPFCGFTL